MISNKHLNPNYKDNQQLNHENNYNKNNMENNGNNGRIMDNRNDSHFITFLSGASAGNLISASFSHGNFL
jgi:hypothetical protein